MLKLYSIQVVLNHDYKSHYNVILYLTLIAFSPFRQSANITQTLKKCYLDIQKIWDDDNILKSSVICSN